MTVTPGAPGRRALTRAHPRVAAALALLGWLGCSAKQDGGQEVRLEFKNGKAENKVYVAANGTESDQLPPTTVRARVQVEGEGVTEIVVRVVTPMGTECLFKVTVDRGPGPYVVDITCSDEDPDGGAPPMSDALPDTGPSAACVRYCMVMHERCPGVYPKGDEDCLATCAAFGWPVGEPGEGAGNNIECRIARARLATTINDRMFCYEAGPTGGNRCGDLCPNFCEAAVRNCPSLAPGGTVRTCADQLCGTRQPSTPSLISDSGNTFECRIFWLGEAGRDEGRTCARLLPGVQDSPCHD
jgi:hypothetical protein